MKSWISFISISQFNSHNNDVHRHQGAFIDGHVQVQWATARVSQCTEIHRKSLLLIIFSSDRNTFTTVTVCLFTQCVRCVQYELWYNFYSKKKFLQFSLFIDHTQKSKIALNKLQFHQTKKHSEKSFLANLLKVWTIGSARSAAQIK